LIRPRGDKSGIISGEREAGKMASKRKAAAMAPVVEDPVDPADELLFLCLGGGNEVGRSCHIIQYKGKTVMVSFGFLQPFDFLC
jgi:predicted metal-dependent RNase